MSMGQTQRKQQLPKEKNYVLEVQITNICIEWNINTHN